jgi:heptosyltransferase II
MKILIELPSWLGDTLMTTPAIDNIIKHYHHVEITLLGPVISIEALKNHPNVVKTHQIDKKIINLYKTLNNLKEFDAFISFRSSLRSKFIKFCISSKNKFQFDKKKYNANHQVEKYNNFINESLKINSIAGKLKLEADNKKANGKNKLLGINPGASYGSAKRWYPKEFAKVASELSNQYDIVIFGGYEEVDIANDIEKYLIEDGVNNYKNLVAKTTITDLINQISKLDLFITADSGPMHIASAFQVPTVAIFGPTRVHETAQWMNKNSIVVKKNLACQPCMRRSCPLKHHNCMKLIDTSDVLSAAKELIKSKNPGRLSGKLYAQ